MKKLQTIKFNRTSRLSKIKQTTAKGHPTFISLGKGVLLGYKRINNKGSWYAKIKGSLLQTKQRYKQIELGLADDHIEADGKSILTFEQAQSKLHEVKKALVDRVYKKAVPCKTFNEVADMYYEDYIARKSRPNSNHKHYVDRIVNLIVSLRKKHKVYPYVLGEIEVNDLTYEDFEDLKRDFANTARQRDYVKVKMDDVEKERRRKSTANRFVCIIKAILNYGYRNKRITGITTDGEWINLKKFKDTDKPRTTWWDRDECQRFLNCCNEPSLRDFFVGAISCGFRAGEQANLLVKDVVLDAQTPHVVCRAEITKTGKKRSVIIPTQFLSFYETLIAGKADNDVLFEKETGHYKINKWVGANNSNHALEPFYKVAAAAGLKKMPWHSLRHTYASQLVNKGVPMKVVANQLGHTTTKYVEQWYGHLANKTVLNEIDKLDTYHNLIKDRTEVVKITRPKGKLPVLRDGKQPNANKNFPIWSVPEDADALLKIQNDPYFLEVQKERRQGVQRAGSSWTIKKRLEKQHG